MLRAVLLGLLTLSAVSCKSHDESQAKSQPGTAAGKVIEVTGTVTLHHGTETRPLAKDEMVDADDEVETGADGSVVIEVQHNTVNWELGANKKGKMRDSLAWTQPKKDKSAKAVDQDSAAAGRHAERSAAESSATATETATADVEEKKEEKSAAKNASAPKPSATRRETEAVPAASAAPTPPVVQPTAPVPTGAPGGGAAATTASPPPPPPPPPPPKTVAKTASKGAAPPTPRAATVAPSKVTNDDFSGLGLTGTGQGGGGAGEGGGGLGSIGTVGRGGGTGGASGGGGAVGNTESATGSETPATAARSLIMTKFATLRACISDDDTVVSLIVKIDAAGKSTITFKTKTAPAIETCVKKVINGLSFAKAAATTSVVLRR